MKRTVGLWILLGGLVASLWAVRELAGRNERQRALPQREGRLRVAELKAPVTIRRGRYGIPHITADHVADALFAVGFVHAQDRLAQMEWLRRSAQGRTAEWVGAAGVEADRWARTLGFAIRAEREAERLDAPTRRALEAYSRGVNARIARVESGEAALPRPLRAVGEVPEPWRPQDCIAVVRLWAWGLNGSVEASLVLSDLIERLGPRAARTFFPPGAAGRIDPLGGSGRSRAGFDRSFRDPLQAAVGLRGRSVGSSAWLVNGALTESGKPFLAGDLHLEATAPGLFYAAHWKADGAEIAGLTLPGAPVFWAGHNGQVVWTPTEARAAVVDLFRETLDDPAQPTRYRTRSGWRALERREESIEVRGGQPEHLMVLTTQRGPLIHRLLPGQRPPLSVAWPGNQSGEGISALLRAARSDTAADFRAALSDHHEPVLVFLYADREGEGGRQLAGFVPLRNLPTELVPVEARAYEWRGRIPFDELPAAALGDDTRWLVAADNPLADFEPVRPLEWWWRLGRRAQRIDQLLRSAAERGRLDLTEMVAIQADVADEGARGAVRRVIELVGDPHTLPAEARRVHELLTRWEGSVAAGETGAAAWHVVRVDLLGTLRAALGEELLTRYLTLRGTSPDALLEGLLEAAQAGVADSRGESESLVGPATLREAARSALRRAGLALRLRLGPDPASWSWGRLHQLRFRPFGWSVEAWGRGAELGPFAYGGDGGTIAAAEYAEDAPFEARLVSAYRIAFDAAHPDLALTALAPGVSEQLGDPLRTSGLQRWLEGRPQVFATHSTLIDELATQELVLEPSP